jgi:hypothetical protein
VLSAAFINQDYTRTSETSTDSGIYASGYLDGRRYMDVFNLVLWACSRAFNTDGIW